MKKMIFEQRLKDGEGVSPDRSAQIVGQKYSGQREQVVQGPKAEACLTCSRNEKGASVAEAE